MKERPILFSAAMVRAILDGTKTQTRRIVTDESVITLHSDGSPAKAQPKCKFGQAGDRLWVRETWRTDDGCDALSPSVLDEGTPIKYEVDDDATGIVPFGWGRIRQSIFMRRWMSRITLEIVSVRVERLQDISEADAMAEGVDGNCPVGHIPSYQKSPCVYHYAQLWESINGPGSWDANPFVWVVEFKRVERSEA